MSGENGARPISEYEDRSYVTPVPIPELGAIAGDTIIVRPGHPRWPLAVLRRFDRATARSLLAHLNALRDLLMTVPAPNGRLQLVRDDPRDVIGTAE